MPAQHHNALQTIRRSGEYLADLIEGLLDISKIEAGRLEIYRNRVNFPDLVQQMELMFREQAAAKSIDFRCHVHNRLPGTVITDEKRLRQILINLLSNAIKYTEHGSVEFHIRYRNQVAEFTVVDTGVGIQQHDLSRILDPFERVRSPEVPNVPGTGLGLTIVKLLTDVMGGDLKISSVPGKGSSFTVNLMFSWTDNPAENLDAFRLISSYLGEKRTLLVVDDEPIHRGLLSDILNPLGFLTIEARDANSCREILQHATPDMLLLDVNMPGCDGLTLAQELRAQGISCPILMISADARELQQAASAPVYDDYLVKPVNNQMLVERIGQLLGLEWTYADHSASADHATSRIIIPARNLPDHPLLRELLAYAQIGHKQGVCNMLDDIAGQQELMDSTTLDGFRHLARNMRFGELADTLERYLS
jgi:CheY-like chemotaxis protein/anti-sigma regulatory factor (Ser/Thr protein kinase)